MFHLDGEIYILSSKNLFYWPVNQPINRQKKWQTQQEQDPSAFTQNGLAQRV
jgi:hypothetical protein